MSARREDALEMMQPLDTPAKRLSEQLISG